MHQAGTRQAAAGGRKGDGSKAAPRIPETTTRQVTRHSRDRAQQLLVRVSTTIHPIGDANSTGNLKGNCEWRFNHPEQFARTTTYVRGALLAFIIGPVLRICRCTDQRKP